MSILNDKQIKELCTPPNFLITTNIPVSDKDNNGLYYLPKPVKSFSYLNEEEIQKEIQKGINNSKNHSFGYGEVSKERRIGVISYRHLLKEELEQFKPMISPFVNGQIRKDEQGDKVISYGLSSAGYDVRLIDEFKIFTNLNNSIIDPLNFDSKCLHDHKGSYCIIPPNSYILGRTVEYFNIPKDIMVVCVGKSTYARCGAIVNVTPIEPGFTGNIVIEISNATSLPLKVYANQGIAQFLFFKMDSECVVSYADRSGKYQNQTTIKTAIG